MSFFGVKYPYTSQQQLNLDWIMDHVANLVPIEHVPPLAGDDYNDVLDMIDFKALEIPKGFSVMVAGTPDDPVDRQCACLLLKADGDNIIGFVMGFSSNIHVNGLEKIGGVWQ